MKSKEYYFDLFESHIISFNKYWEDPIYHSPLRNNTLETLDLLESYFKILQTKEKELRRKLARGIYKYAPEAKNIYECNDEVTEEKLNDYNKYPEDVRNIINEIVNLINDGRDLYHEVEYHNVKGNIFDNTENTIMTKRYDHHVKKNGHLYFENEPWGYIKGKLSDIEHLREIINSEKSTGDFSKYIDGKWHLFQGYENGSVSVRFTKINKDKNGNYIFDGDMISWATIDSQYDGDGVIFNSECEDVSFEELPYCDGKFDSDEELMEFIDNCEKIETDKEIKESVHNIMDSYLEDIL